VLDDGDVSIFESGAIVDYILERHRNGGLKPAVSDQRFPAYLQWFHYCEGMIMPPVNTIVVHTLILPEERRDATVLGQAKRLLTNALAPVDAALVGKDYLTGEFSGADIMLGHACFMSNRVGCVPDEMANLKAYVARIAARPDFQTAIRMQ
jgi:glutathione S-transferase